MTDRPGASTKYQVRAVSAAFKILGGLAETPRQTLSQLSSSLAMSNSLIYRMLATLEGEGMVYRDHHRRYSLGSRAMYLGYQAQRSLPVNEVAQPVIERLVEATSETVHLVLRAGLERVIVAMKESPQPVRVSTPIGTKFPMYYGGTGLCMFAYLPGELQEQILSRELQPKTPLMERDPTRIRELARTIKERGYHVAVGDFANDAFSIAAPVFGTDGHVLGAICVVGPDSRLTEEAQGRAVAAVKAAAGEISAALGYVGGQ
ncbi:MAG: IclR family transcriptional regulator [Trueperaceae bacterium]|nr:IclR family transcriptional regulator [Trueperaceae bacterium]MCC6311714.1 IclR family transcriptional regulator [Trueperaceae bacterium]MCO5173141.1 IclR family transcriptional regulator [Trueperaceae bacterium]MCW5818457.1 IclR family transcriptional regulator [Trueperaceae bacterium]